MSKQNEIRRVKTKLALFDIEGVNGLLYDMIDVITGPSTSLLSQERKIRIVRSLKEKYLKYLEENESKKPGQKTLFD